MSSVAIEVQVKLPLAEPGYDFRMKVVERTRAAAAEVIRSFLLARKCSMTIPLAWAIRMTRQKKRKQYFYLDRHCLELQPVGRKWQLVWRGYGIVNKTRRVPDPPQPFAEAVETFCEMVRDFGHWKEVS